jgi:hypothetical protein
VLAADAIINFEWTVLPHISYVPNLTDYRLLDCLKKTVTTPKGIEEPPWVNGCRRGTEIFTGRKYMLLFKGVERRLSANLENT